MSRKRKITLGTCLIYLLSIFILLIIIIPVLNLAAKSFSDPVAANYMNGWQIWPSKFSLIHYKVILSNKLVWRAFLNSVIITGAGVIFSVFLTCSAAYALSDPRLMGRKYIMGFMIVLMIVEPTIIQEYFVYKSYGLLNKLLCMIMYNSVNIYYLIVLMRFFSETPQSILEAARIDGANEFQVMFRVFLPLNKVPVITISMFYAVSKWNEYYRSSVFLTQTDKMVLQTFLRSFIVGGETSFVLPGGSALFNSISELNLSSLKAATIVVAVVPILCLYPIILKYFTNGVLTGGVKE